MNLLGLVPHMHDRGGHHYTRVDGLYKSSMEPDDFAHRVAAFTKFL